MALQRNVVQECRLKSHPAAQQDQPWWKDRTEACLWASPRTRLLYRTLQHPHTRIGSM